MGISLSRSLPSKSKVGIAIVLIGIIAGIVCSLVGINALFLIIVELSILVQRYPDRFLIVLSLGLPLTDVLLQISFHGQNLAAPIDILVALSTSLYLTTRLLKVSLGHKMELDAKILFIMSLLIVWAVVSFFWSISPAGSFHEFTRDLSTFGTFGMLLDRIAIRGKCLYRKLIEVSTLGSVYVVALGIIQLVFGIGLRINSGVVRVHSLFLYTNNYGYYLIAIIVMMYAYARSTDGAKRVSIYLMFSIAVLSALTTQSRAVWIGLYGALMLMFWLSGVRWANFLLIIIGAIAPFLPQVNRRLNEALVGLHSVVGTNLNNSVSFRLYEWKVLLSYVTGWHALVGYGLGSPNIFLNVYLNTADAGAHNELVSWLVEQGVVGLGLMGGVALTVIYRVARGVNKQNPSRLANIVALASLWSYLVIVLSDNPTSYYDVNFYYSILIAGAIGLSSRKADSYSNNPQLLIERYERL